MQPTTSKRKSSFPNGGIRNTFEARGYTAWDVSSPAFIVDSTLCIPTIFISYTGEALDYKTPLLKALGAVDKAATEVCRMFDPNVKRVFANLGWEQEYFLVDTALYNARPDLCLTGRTLMGHSSAKDQQLDDHYFGSIPPRVTSFMKELELECHKLGIPVKTRHNEVAPNQFELAPIFGANEAPPAILSIFLGRHLSHMLDEVVARLNDAELTPDEKKALQLGIGRIPAILQDNTDRNRTSPFAFTGNRFEFRAAGSSANCAASMIVINAAMAHQLNEFKTQIDKLVNGGMEQEEALYKVLKETIIASQNIRFEGDGYSEEWKAEAARRGLTNICHVPEAILKFNDEQSRAVLIGEKIFNENELFCRIEVELEKFTKKVQIESRVLGDLAINHIVPTAVIYQNRLLENLRGLKEIFSTEEKKERIGDKNLSFCYFLKIN